MSGHGWTGVDMEQHRTCDGERVEPPLVGCAVVEHGVVEQGGASSVYR